MTRTSPADSCDTKRIQKWLLQSLLLPPSSPCETYPLPLDLSRPLFKRKWCAYSHQGPQRSCVHSPSDPAHHQRFSQCKLWNYIALFTLTKKGQAQHATQPNLDQQSCLADPQRRPEEQTVNSCNQMPLGLCFCQTQCSSRC